MWRRAASATLARSSIGGGWRKRASACGCRPRPLEGDAGLGPGDEGEAVAALQRGLLEFGYGVEVTTTYGTGLEKVVEAFQRHFRPARIDGRADKSTIETLSRLLAARRGIAEA